jgi:hypothetical protein
MSHFAIHEQGKENSKKFHNNFFQPPKFFLTPPQKFSYPPKGEQCRELVKLLQDQFPDSDRLALVLASLLYKEKKHSQSEDLLKVSPIFFFF